jgi:putative transposase
MPESATQPQHGLHDPETINRESTRWIRAQALGEMLRDHCSLYNGALQERRDAYRHASKTTVRYGQQSAQLKDIRAFDPKRQGRWSFSSQQATLRRLEKPPHL